MLVNQVFYNSVPGPEGPVYGWIITVTFTHDEMQAILAQYDPASATSPSVTVCRPIVRPMLDAVIAYQPTRDGT